MLLFFDDKLVSFDEDGFTIKLGPLKFKCPICDHVQKHNLLNNTIRAICSDCPEISKIKVTGDTFIYCNDCALKAGQRSAI